MKKIATGIFFLLIIVDSLMCYKVYFYKNNVKVEKVKENIKLSNKIEKKLLDYNENVEININDELPSMEDYFKDYNGEKIIDIKYYKDAEEVLEEDITVGNYRVEINIENIIYNINLTILDNTTPILKLKNVTITEGSSYNINSFVVSCEDNTKCELKYTDDSMSNYKNSGRYNISIEASDLSGNKVVESAILTINKKVIKKIEVKNVEKTETVVTTKEEVNSAKTTKEEVKQAEKEEAKEDKKEQTIVKEEQKVENDVKVTYKYGVKITTSNGKTTYDHSTFNATTSDLKDEAASILASNTNDINTILNGINSYRNAIGVSNIQLDQTLNLAATIRAMEMVYARKFSHTRPDGTSCFTIFKDLGYYKSYYGENIASHNTANGALILWRNSPPHYANMVSTTYTKIGIGKAYFDNRTYWVLNFSN